MLHLKESTLKTNKTKLSFDFVIVGLGKTGLSCVHYLLQQGFTVAVVDSSPNPSGLATVREKYDGVSLYLGEMKQEVLLAANQIVLSPSVPLSHPLVKKAITQGIPICSDIELFCLQAQAPIIAISGTNGKSTVTTLVAEMAKAAGIKTKSGGNLGTPALELLQGESAELYVLELSSFQLEITFSLKAHASTVLNISPDHMDRYASFADYIKAKQRIYAGSKVMVINKDDPILKTMADNTKQTYTFSLTEPDDKNFGVIKVDNDFWLCRGQQKIIKQSDLQLQGRHNVSNVLAAMALASAVNVPTDVMVNALTNFSGLPHRCQKVATINNVSWYNDSKATNVDACIAAVNSLCHLGQIILIAGGDSKGADLSSLVPILDKYVKKVILLGADASKFSALLTPSIPYKFAANLEAAVDLAKQYSQAGDLVLLSPACSSLDMFQNYQQRGTAFIAAVEALGAQ